MEKGKEFTKSLTPGEDLEIKSTNKGTPYASFTANEDGEMYQCWKQPLLGHLSVGTTQKMTIQIKEANGWEYRNVIDIVGVKGKKGQPVAPVRGGAQSSGPGGRRGKGGKPDFKSEFEERARGQAKGAAFNKCCDIVIAMYNKGDVKPNKIVDKINELLPDLINTLYKAQPKLKDSK